MAENIISKIHVDDQDYSLLSIADNELNASSTNPIQNQAVSAAIDEATTTANAIKVELGEGGTVGGYKTGDTITAGTSIQSILNKILQKSVAHSYVKPKLTVAAQAKNSGATTVTAAGNYEYGTNITTQIKATFTKNEAGDLTGITMKKNSTTIEATAEGNNSNIYWSNVDTFTLSETTKYTATASYGQGPISNDNLGNPSPEGRIEAGNISGTVTYSPYRSGYFYGVLATDSSTPLTSAIIRSGTRKSGAYAAGDLPEIKASAVANRKRIFVACPKSNIGVVDVIMPSAMNANCKADFGNGLDDNGRPIPKYQVSVEGANGYEGLDYNVWVYEPASISDDQTFKVTLG